MSRAHHRPPAARAVRRRRGSGALTRGRTDVGARRHLHRHLPRRRGRRSRSPRSRSNIIPAWRKPRSSATSRRRCARWPLLGVTVIHRHGRIAPGEDIVLVVTASSHREAAFAAAEFLMDYLKTRAPFWKQVEKAGGKTWVEAESRRRRGGRALAARAQGSSGGMRAREGARRRRHDSAGDGGDRGIDARRERGAGGASGLLSRCRAARIRTTSRRRRTARSGTPRSRRARSAFSIRRPARPCRFRSAPAPRRTA